MRTASLPASADSRDEAITRFDSSLVAKKYPDTYGSSFRERREVACIHAALQHVPGRASILDLPCGTGRLHPELVKAGFKSITGADSSRHMLDRAEYNWRTRQKTTSARFVQCDALKTSFADGQFETIICNRLFHHFREPAIRVAALQELRRISTGRIIVSFFRDFGWSALRFRLKHALRGTVPVDRIPIGYHAFAKDIEAAGLTVVSSHAVLWGVSPMWYVVLDSPASAKASARAKVA